MTNQLVTIGVVAYNSAAFVVDTLESAKKQTYQNIELIISDDGSTDNTVELCEQWLSNNKNRFVRSQIITVPANTGTAGNCNRVLDNTKGEWLKLIAADDVLCADAISNYMECVNNSAEIEALFGKAKFFYMKDGIRIETPTKYTIPKVFFSDTITAEKQYRILLKMFEGSAPTFFVRTSLLREVGGFDMKYPLQEDYPLYIKLTRSGHKLYLLNKETVFIRNNSQSVTRSKSRGDIYRKFRVHCLLQYKDQYRRDYMSRFWLCMHDISLRLHYNVIRCGNTFESARCRFYYLLQRCFDPFRWYLLVRVIQNKLSK